MIGSVFVIAGPGTLYELDSTSWKTKMKFDFFERWTGLSHEEFRHQCPFDIKLDPRDWK